MGLALVRFAPLHTGMTVGAGTEQVLFRGWYGLNFMDAASLEYLEDTTL